MFRARICYCAAIADALPPPPAPPPLAEHKQHCIITLARASMAVSRACMMTRLYATMMIVISGTQWDSQRHLKSLGVY
jgi:hypothetical protein